MLPGVRSHGEAPGPRAALPPGARPTLQVVLGVVQAEAAEAGSAAARARGSRGSRPTPAHALGGRRHALRTLGNLQAHQGQPTGSCDALCIRRRGLRQELWTWSKT